MRDSWRGRERGPYKTEAEDTIWDHGDVCHRWEGKRRNEKNKVLLHSNAGRILGIESPHATASTAGAHCTARSPRSSRWGATFPAKKRRLVIMNAVDWLIVWFDAPLFLYWFNRLIDWLIEHAIPHCTERWIDGLIDWYMCTEHLELRQDRRFRTSLFSRETKKL